MEQLICNEKIVFSNLKYLISRKKRNFRFDDYFAVNFSLACWEIFDLY